MFSKDDPFCGIDFDNCRNSQTGKTAAWADDLIRGAKSYAEISPSGCGVKMIVKGKLPSDKGKRCLADEGGEIELYEHSRFFAITANVISDNVSVAEAQSVIDTAWKKYVGTTQEHTETEKCDKSQHHSELKYSWKTFAPLAQEPDEEIPYLIENVLAEGEPTLICGQFKTF